MKKLEFLVGRTLVSMVLCFWLFVSFSATAATPTETVSKTPRRQLKKAPVDVKGTQPQPNAKGAPNGPTAQADGATHVHSLRAMLEQGTTDGNFRFYDFTSHNAFVTKSQNQNTGSYGGKLGLTTATLYGFSLRLAAYAQRGIDHTDDTVDTAAFALAPDITALGEAYLQWQDHDVSARVGNQRLDAPFTSSLPGFPHCSANIPRRDAACWRRG